MNNDVVVKFTADTATATNDIKKLSTEVAKIGNAVKSVNKLSESLKAINGAGLGNTSRSFLDLSRSLQSINSNDMQKIGNGFQNIARALKQLELSNGNQSITQLSNSFRSLVSLSVDSKNVGTNINSMRQSVSKLGDIRTMPNLRPIAIDLTALVDAANRSASASKNLNLLGNALQRIGQRSAGVVLGGTASQLDLIARAAEAATVNSQRLADTLRHIGQSRAGRGSPDAGGADSGSGGSGNPPPMGGAGGLNDFFSNNIGGFLGGAIGARFGATGAVAGAFVGSNVETKLKEWVKQTQEIMQARQAFIAAFKTQEGANMAMKDSFNMANEYGLDAMEVVKGYSQFTSSSEFSTLSGDTGKKLFKQMLMALHVQNAGPQQVKGAFKAITDSINKGAITAEEFFKQIVNHMKGTNIALSQAAGMEMDAMVKAMKNRELKPDEILPLFGDILEKTYAPAMQQTLAMPQAKVARAKNQYLENLVAPVGGFMWDVAAAGAPLVERAFGFLGESKEDAAKRTKPARDIYTLTTEAQNMAGHINKIKSAENALKELDAKRADKGFKPFSEEQIEKDKQRLLQLEKVISLEKDSKIEHGRYFGTDDKLELNALQEEKARLQKEINFAKTQEKERKSLESKIRVSKEFVESKSPEQIKFLTAFNGLSETRNTLEQVIARAELNERVSPEERAKFKQQLTPQINRIDEERRRLAEGASDKLESQKLNTVYMGFIDDLNKSHSNFVNTLKELKDIKDNPIKIDTEEFKRNIDKLTETMRLFAEPGSSSRYVPPVPGYSTGGRIPGFGGGDTVPAMLERGEWIINAKRAAMFNPLLTAINSRPIHEVQEIFNRKQINLMAPVTSETIRLDLSINGGQPLSVHGQADQVRAWQKALKEHQRGKVSV